LILFVESAILGHVYLAVTFTATVIFKVVTEPHQAMGKSFDKVFHVLVADNSSDDRLLLRRAIRLIDGFEIVAELSNPVEVIAYLHGDAPFADRRKFPLPDLILLYLQKPIRNSFEVLKWIRESAPYKMMVVVLTDSMEINHIKKALDL